MSRQITELLIYALFAAVLTLFAFLHHLSAGFFVLLSSVLFLLLYTVFAHLRSRKIKKLAENLERILHNQESTLRIKDSKEGALSILESEIQKMTTRLHEQSERLIRDKIGLQDAITDIFHQIRTPLTAINIAISRLSKEDIDYETRISLLRDVKRQVERSKWLTESLLKMSKIDAGTAKFKAEPVPVRSLVEKAIAPLLIPIELSQIELIREINEEHFIGDLDWTAEAISNLVKNAVEHFTASALASDPPMSDSAKSDSAMSGLPMTASPEEEEPETNPERRTIRISASETPLYTQIVVADNGGGFAEEEIPRLFERYYKGARAGANSIGVGLALCKKIITSQNGTIKADNTAGGARFIIKFYKNII